MISPFGLADPCCGIGCSYCREDKFHAEMLVYFSGVRS